MMWNLLPRHAIWKFAVLCAEKELLQLQSVSSKWNDEDLCMALQLTSLVGNVYVGHVSGAGVRRPRNTWRAHCYGGNR